MAAIISGKVYIDKGNVRAFDPSYPDEEFVWHRDREDRKIEILEGEGWQFQVENCLPWLLEEGMSFVIKKGEYHRLIKGVTPLIINIEKYHDE